VSTESLDVLGVQLPRRVISTGMRQRQTPAALEKQIPAALDKQMFVYWL
jgi:hypothetical protein